MPSTFSLISSNKRPSKVSKTSTIGIEVDAKKDLLSADSFLKSGAVDVQVLDLSEFFDEV